MQPVQRKFKMPIADLAVFTSNLVANMRRDAVQFTSRNITNLDTDALEALGNAFEIFPPDIDYLGQVMEAVDTKDALHDTIVQNIQYISGYVEQKWGLDSPRYKRLNISGIQHVSESRFLHSSRNVVTLATEWQADLTPLGLTLADITTLSTNAQAFEDAINDVNAKKQLRESKATERIEKGNEIYELVKEYCTIGKLIWENVNESYYNDYLITKRSADLPGKPLNLNYDVINFNLHWDASPNSLSYEAEYRNSATGFTWSVIYSGPEIDCHHNPGDGSWLYRVRGHNAEGYGNWSDELSVVLPV